MFETAELGQSVSNAEYKVRAAELRERLLELQYMLRARAEFPVFLYFAGVDGAGKGTTVNLLHSWLDARALVTNAYGPPTEDESDRPEYWRYWRDLPGKGQIGLNLSGRYSRPFIEKVYSKITTDEFYRQLDRIRSFERALASDGAIIIKFWMHLSREEQKERLEALQNDPVQSWRVTERDWKHYNLYDRFISTAEDTLTYTQSELTPWHIVEGVDSNFRVLTVAEILANALEERLGPPTNGQNNGETPEIKVEELDQLPERPPGLVTILSRLDMSPRLKKDEYEKKLAKQQQRIHLLQREALKKRVSTVVVMEGPDAAGKGGAIRRMIPSLDARNYRILQYGAPTDEELSHHYLWRFWRYIGAAGRLTVFDRSWYGRVLVERVLSLASDAEWQRAYAEINEFEEQLMSHDAVVVKFWLHIDEDEQLARFVKRGTRQHKRWKLTDEDWRNRKDWYEYEKAAHDIVQYTSTRRAPWNLVPANNKNYARVAVLKTVCDQLEAKLESLED
jgi:polyphosphate:AMP phosphotransferase